MEARLRPMTEIEEYLADSAERLLSFAAREIDSLLARLESSPDVSLVPKDCFRLFSQLGAMELSPWLRLLPVLERPVFMDLASRLQARLQGQVERKRDALSRCVSQGLQLRIQK